MPERALLELLRGRGAHVDPVACVEDLSPDLAGRQLAGFPHSIWQLLSHMNYWMDYELKRIDDAAPPYPEHASESWPKNPAPENGKLWSEAIAKFKSLLEKLNTLAVATPNELSREINPTHASHAKIASSLESVLWQLLVHNSYHIGQIAMIRRALGAWPPQGGGDTW